MLAWKRKHGSTDYPFETPYEELIARRPDLPQLPLTCENTNTLIPYIDVVNEILEYFVAHKKLDANAAHDVGDHQSDELLAEPQHVVDAAYSRLRSARYPTALPFDLWLETVREFTSYFQNPLADVLDAFRPNDDLFSTSAQADRSCVLVERLGFSQAEFELLTDPSPLSRWRAPDCCRRLRSTSSIWLPRWR